MQERSGKLGSQRTAGDDAQVGHADPALGGKPEVEKDLGRVQENDDPGGGVDTGGGPKSGTPGAGSIAGA